VDGCIEMKKRNVIFTLLVVILFFPGLTACGLVGNADNTPVFSVGSGFYEEEFDLKLRAGMGLEIYFTTDGSDPRTSDTAMVYDTAIRIYDNTAEANRLSNIADITLSEYYPPNKPVDKGIIIRAATKDGKGNFSEVVTNSYFVGKDKSYYSKVYLRVCS
jgi:hypothetical protein